MLSSHIQGTLGARKWELEDGSPEESPALRSEGRAQRVIPRPPGALQKLRGNTSVLWSATSAPVLGQSLR